MKQTDIGSRINALLTQFAEQERRQNKFIPGVTKIRYSGAFYDAAELIAVTQALLSGWFGLGLYGDKLERGLSRYIGSHSTLLTNSGSSASLLSMAALTSYLYADRIEPGAEIITPACTFATTAAAIIHRGLIPVFVDNEIDTFNPTPQMIADAITRKTRVIFLPHTLGNPNEMDKIVAISRKHKLLLVEDNCDALGSEYRGVKTGSFGVLATCSFYPAHHITMAGEGGAVFINDPRLHRVILTLRNWGRGCWCTSREKHVSGACRNRFNFKIDGIPIDHKYYFLELGYNLKPVELQAAMGFVQLKRFPSMAKKRRDNFSSLYKFFKNHDKFFILPRSLPQANPCWFSFPLTLREGVPFTRQEITSHLESKKIETRTVFAGNIVRQPALKRAKYKVVGKLSHADKVLKDTFFIGIGPHLGAEELTYVKETSDNFLKKF